jgi:hypothetical protein
MIGVVRYSCSRLFPSSLLGRNKNSGGPKRGSLHASSIYVTNIHSLRSNISLDYPHDPMSQSGEAANQAKGSPYESSPTIVGIGSHFPKGMIDVLVVLPARQGFDRRSAHQVVRTAAARHHWKSGPPRAHDNRLQGEKGQCLSKSGWRNHRVHPGLRKCPFQRHTLNATEGTLYSNFVNDPGCHLSQTALRKLRH